MSFVFGSTEEIEAIQNVTAESLASYAGAIDEGTKESNTILKGQLGLLQRKPRSEQHRVYHEVAAKYLPAIVEKFRQSENSLNPAMSLLNLVTFTPYFSRFLRFPQSEGIAALQMSRMATEVSNLDSYAPDEIAEIGQFLSTILLLQGSDGVDKQHTKTLTPKFKAWSRKYPRSLAGEVGERCIMMLSNNAETNRIKKMMKGQMGGALEKCGGPGCNRTSRADGSELLQCARCRIALYCGAEHQKAAWPSHKTICFKTSF